MSPERTERVRELFLTARALDRGERTDFLLRVTAGDATLLQEVRELLEAEEHGDRFLESPALGHDFRDQAVESIVTEHEERQLERIGPYRVEELIGEGGFARVYAAQQETPVRRRVAIKLLKPGVATRQVIRRFEAERQHLANMDHPAIAHVFDAGATEDERPYFVMEFIDGAPITEFCDSNRLEHRARVELVSRVCEAVQHAHSKGVIHRDLKPSNILVGNHPDDPHIKIIDFGIAKAIRESVSEPATQTRTGQIVGTLPYASPEQLSQAAHTIDTRSDVYALGVVLYELLTGKLPHDVRQDSIAAAALRITRETPARLGSIDTSLRGDLETIVGKALSHEPDERYQSASELAADLRRFLNGDAILARPASLSYQLRKLAARHRGATAGALVTIVIFVAAFVWVVGAERRAQREYETARATAHFLLSRIIDDLGNVTGKMETRRELLDKVLPFVRQHRDDPDVARDYVHALWAASDLAMEQGQLAEVKEDREAALKMLEGLAEQSPADLDLRASRSIALVKVGDYYKAAGNVAEAEALYRRALAIDEELVAASPDSRRYRSNLAWSHQRLGAHTARRHDLEATQAHFARYAELAGGLLTEEPGNHTARYGLYECEAILTDLYWRMGASDVAGEHARRAWEHLGRAFELAPGNRRYRRAIPIALRYLSRMSGQHGDWPAAANLMDEAISRIESSLRLEPDNNELQYLLGSLLCERATLALYRGDSQACAADLDRADGLVEAALAASAAHVRWRYLLIRILTCHQRLAAHQGNADAAAAHAERACEVYGELAEPTDADPMALQGFADCLRCAADADESVLARALQYAQRANEAGGGRDPHTLKLIAEIEFAQGHHANALTAIEAAQALVAPNSALSLELDELASRGGD